MQLTAGQKKEFTERLIEWHTTLNKRTLPWKKEKDPYRIWLSEILLQQTRAQQGIPYYHKFIDAYPTLQDLAAAPEDDVFRLWQGLGYYNRCKNMLATARYICNHLDGHFPGTYEGLLGLKGIGPYTAAAIASFAFGLPQAVVDGNVYRVLSRYWGIDTPFDTLAGKVLFQNTASDLLYTKDSALYNQAIMDHGALICSPARPSCGECLLQKGCVAHKQQMVDLLPVRSKRTTVKNRFFHYIWLLADDKVWVQKRTGNDIWQNLHEPFLVEHDKKLSVAELAAHKACIQLPFRKKTLYYEGHLVQRLTHQKIESHFFTARLEKTIEILPGCGIWMATEDLKKLAFPKTLVSFLEKKLYF